MLTNTILLRQMRWLAVIATWLVLSCDQLQADDGNIEPTGEPIALTLTLDPPSADENRFDVETFLNTLVPGATMKTAGGAVSWTGTVGMQLYVDGMNDGLPNITGVKVNGSSAMIEQSAIGLVYGDLPVDVDFNTSPILSKLEQFGSNIIPVMPGPIPGEYEIGTDELFMMQMDGLATVAIEARPSETQDIGADPMLMSMDGNGGAMNPTLLIQALGGSDDSNFLATLRVPMAGQVIEYTGTGLPVEWQYTSGDMVAAGMFTVPLTNIPEPSSAALACLLIALGGWRLRRAG